MEMLALKLVSKIKRFLKKDLNMQFSITREACYGTGGVDSYFTWKCWL